MRFFDVLVSGVLAYRVAALRGGDAQMTTLPGGLGRRTVLQMGTVGLPGDVINL